MSCHELPKIGKNGGRGEDALSCEDLPKIGENWRRGAAAASCHFLLENGRIGSPIPFPAPNDYILPKLNQLFASGIDYIIPSH
jgi:hypothetical protein